METRRLEYFAVLVREGSFRRAAEMLFISQPALSQQIQRLETEVGAVLIDRGVQPFELTPAGRELLDRGNRILAELGGMADVAKGVRRGHVGKLRVGIAPSLLHSGLPALIGRFRATHPGVDVSLRREDTWAIMDQLADQRLDIGLTFSPRGPAAVTFATLYEDSFVAVLPSGHRLTSEPSVRVSDLRSEAFLMIARLGLPDLHDAVISACGAAGFSPRVIDTGLNSTGAGYIDQIGLVAAGYGVALIPAAVATLAIEGAVYRPVTRPSVTLATSIGWNPSSPNTSIETLRSFLLPRPNVEVCAQSSTPPPETPRS